MDSLIEIRALFNVLEQQQIVLLLYRYIFGYLFVQVPPSAYNAHELVIRAKDDTNLRLQSTYYE